MKQFRLCLRALPFALAICALLAFAAGLAGAEDYAVVVRQIFETGEYRGETRDLAFIDGNLHQYAVAQGSAPESLSRLTFIQEEWTRAGDQDIIDQWIITVFPYEDVAHNRIVERDAEVLSTERVGTEGADAIARHIVEKVRQQGRRASLPSRPVAAPGM